LLEGNEGGPAGTLKGRAVVVASDGSVVLDQALVDAPLREVAEWGPLPDVLSVLRQLPGRVPHVRVLIDRTGADVTYVGTPGQAHHDDTEETTIQGETFHLRKVRVGGWAHDHWQNSAENQWEANAARVAERITEYARRTSPQFVLIAGDVRARNILAGMADDVWKDLVVTMDEGGRAAGADRAPVDAREGELVAEHEARECARVLEQVQAAAAHGLSVTGTGYVVEAMRKNQVETLVLADEPDREFLFVGNTPLELGVDAADIGALGGRAAHQVPAERALVAAAVTTKADVVVLPRAAMPGDIPVAAVLRYTDDSTPS
jgi:hypothetical protein